MKDFFNGNGVLTKDGLDLLLELNTALDNLMASDHVMDMTENDLRLLGSHLSSMIGNIISKRISTKLQTKTQFDIMTDDEFYAYLEQKYGQLWRLLTLTHEEYHRVPQLSDEDIKKALEEGARHRKAVEDVFYPFIDPSIRFK
jgi:hypothetical protein